MIFKGNHDKLDAINAMLTIHEEVRSLIQYNELSFECAYGR
jgi:hypothetical protein